MATDWKKKIEKVKETVTGFSAKERQQIKESKQKARVSAEKKYSAEAEKRRIKKKYSSKTQRGFQKFSKQAGKSMENIGKRSGTGPVMIAPSSYYQETSRAVKRSKKKRSIPSYYSYTRKY